MEDHWFLCSSAGYLRGRDHPLAEPFIRRMLRPQAPIRSLAVLPLENLSGDTQDYFADGMTDELIADLAQIGALRVISRTSVMPYKGARKPLPVIATRVERGCHCGKVQCCVRVTKFGLPHS